MKETAFVKKNYPRWQEFESLLNTQQKTQPDLLAALFVQITDDLSFSRTQYPQSQTTQYLNDLASRVHLEVYKNKKEDKRRFITFWKYELPILFRRYHTHLLTAFIIFMVAIAIGMVSTLNDDTFARLILGDAYVNMTLENIEKGNPLAVYGKMGEADMFFAITFNNIRVSFTVFAMGLLASLGTGYVLFSNGLMVGVFFTFLAQKGLLLSSSLIIMLHGTLELSAIVIAAAAGFAMGNSLLFPGTYSRIASFKRGAKDGLKIIVGLLPVFIMAGFIEGFFTRYTFMHWSIKVAVILLSTAFILYYFVIYPIKLTKHEHVSAD